MRSQAVLVDNEHHFHIYTYLAHVVVHPDRSFVEPDLAGAVDEQDFALRQSLDLLRHEHLSCSDDKPAYLLLLPRQNSDRETWILELQCQPS